MILILLALATFRLSYMISYEQGPYDIITKIRSWFGAKHHFVTYNYETTEWSNGTPYVVVNEYVRVEPMPAELQEGFWARMLCCPYCNSIYIGATLLILNSQYDIISNALYYVIVVLSLSTVSIVIKSYVDK